MSESPGHGEVGRELAEALRATIAGDFQWTGVIVHNTADVPVLAAMAIGYAARMLESYVRVFSQFGGLTAEQRAAFVEAELGALAEGRRPGAVTPDSEGGFQLSYPGDDEAVGPMLGLVHAIMWQEEEAEQAIVAAIEEGARPLVLTLAATVCALLAGAVRGGIDPDAAPGPLTVEQRQHAEAILVMGVTRPADDLGSGTGT